ncbi:putative ATP-dependent RNA helicase ddx47 [Glugoides intestinalis]
MSLNDLKLNEKIIAALKEHNITELTPIQKAVFPSAANGHDVIGVSQTGSGKTIAFLLPLIHQIILSDKPFHALILSPTHELALQIVEMLTIFKSLNIRYALLIGGEDFNTQANALSKRPHIVIGTPGRIVKHIEKTKSFHIERIRKLLFDEADCFFEKDFVLDLEQISKRLVKKNQTMMFTATITERCKKLSSLFMRSPKIYNLLETIDKITLLKDNFIFIPEKYKLTVLYNYLSERKDQAIIVFVGLCALAQKVSLTLSNLQLSCQHLHGKMPQAKRAEIITGFREKSFNILVSTDVASRGLDIPHVEHVINYDLPENAKIYTHRIGRTARAGKEGHALSFVTQYDVEKLQQIEYSLKRKIPDQKYNVYINDKKVKDVFEEVNTLCNLDKSFRD